MMAVTALLAAVITFGGIHLIVDSHKRNWEQ